MSALLVDPMVRVFGVWQDNLEVANFIVRMGNFEKFASKTDSSGQFGGTTRYPDYLMRADGTTDNRSDTDVQHAMDVGAVAAWATYFADLRGTPDASLRQLANDLYAAYDVGVNFWTRPGGTNFNVSPPRRYTWEYKNSPSFSWALISTDAPSQAGMLRFSSPSISFVENQPSATITVARVGGSTGSVSVNYATTGGTATAGSDYTATTGTLNFANGETSKTFTIPILNDTTVENMETVILTLSNPTGGASLNSPATAILSIDSDDTTSTPITLTFQQGVSGYSGTTDADISNQYGGNGSTGRTGNQLGVYQTTGASSYTIEGLVRFNDLIIKPSQFSQAVSVSDIEWMTVVPR
jgi:Calx-beta domain